MIPAILNAIKNIFIYGSVNQKRNTNYICSIKDLFYFRKNQYFTAWLGYTGAIY